MPYDVQAVGDGRYKVVNTDTGNVHSKGTTRANAEAQVRLLRDAEHGTKPRTTREAAGIPKSGSSSSTGRHRAKRSSKPAPKKSSGRSRKGRK